MSFAEIRRTTDRIRDVPLGTWNGLAERPSQRKVRRNRCGKRAPGAVRMATGHARVTELDELAVLEQHVHDVVGLVMAALDQDCRSAQRGDATRRLTSIPVARDAYAAQRFGLWNVGGHEKRFA